MSSPWNTSTRPKTSKKSTPLQKTTSPRGTPTTSASASYMKPRPQVSFKYTGSISPESPPSSKATSAFRGSPKASLATAKTSPPGKKVPPTKSSSAAGGTLQNVKQRKESSNSRPVSSPRSTPSSTTTTTTSVKRLFPRSGECVVCKQVCRSHCAGCKRVFYCCKQHQQADWSKHKLVCRPFSIPTQYSSGFHLRPPGVSSSSSFPNKNSSSQTKFEASSAELQFMLTTKQIHPGNVIFTEKPLLIVANIYTPTEADLETPSGWCCSCLKVSKNSSYLDSNGNRISSKCSKCNLPLCPDCVNDPTGNSQKFHPGQGHSPEECALLAELSQKSPDFLDIPGLPGNKNFLRDLTILRVLMFRTLCPWRWESIIALRHSPRYTACVKHNFGKMDAWLSPDSTDRHYPMAHYYWTNICKEKNIQLADVIKVVSIFCEVSEHNSSFLTLYENLSWISHACTPNAEQFSRAAEPTMELVVKAVNNIEEGSKVFINYISNFEGGRSSLALKLFQKKGLYCSDTGCVCHEGGFDKSLGIRCDLIPIASSDTFNACSGIISPSVDAPNPDKANLGMTIFAKSKLWECNKCKKSEKYGALQSKIMTIAQELSQGCDNLCTTQGKGHNQSFLHLQSKLLANLSDQHWMVWKARLRILKTWNEALGYGPEMLKSAVALPFESPARDNLIQIVKYKVDMYGSGIYDIISESGKSKGKQMKGKMGVLELFSKRYGKLSPKRGELLLDAFYANLIIFMEDYRKELPLPLSSTVKRTQVAGESSKKLKIVKDLAEKTVQSLKIGEAYPGFKNHVRFLQMASQSLETLTPVFNRVQKNPISILSYMNDLMEVYAGQDPDFVTTLLAPSQPKLDPFSCELALEFETDRGNCGPAIFTFGAGPSPSTLPTASSSSNKNKLPFAKYKLFTFSGFDSSATFGNYSKNEDDDSSKSSTDDDDDDSPFVYSSKKKTPPPSTKRSTGTTGRNFNDEDWSTFFSLSSDDESDTAFKSKTPDFDDDIYNDEALDDLAEWAAFQFMIGKMKI